MKEFDIAGIHVHLGTVWVTGGKSMSGEKVKKGRWEPYHKGLCVT